MSNKENNIINTEKNFFTDMENILHYKNISKNFNYEPINFDEESKIIYDNINKENFLIFKKNIIYLINYEGKLISTIKNNFQIKFFTLDKTSKQYLYFVDFEGKCFIYNIQKKKVINLVSNENNFLGGFFITNFYPSNSNKIKFCNINKGYLLLIDLILNYQKKDASNSKKNSIRIKYKIDDFLYNDKFKVLIIREKNNFHLINLRNIKFFNKIFNLIIKDFNIETSSYFLVNLYNKLIFIHKHLNQIDFYYLKNVENLDKIKTINLDNNQINNKNFKLQFINNLIVYYCINCIYIYDIKGNKKENYLISKIQLDNEHYISFDKFNIFSKIILYKNNFYLVGFDINKFYSVSNGTIIDRIIILLRRKHISDLLKKILLNLINLNEINTFIEIIKLNLKNFKKNQKKKNDNNNNELLNEKKIISNKKQYYYYISQEFIFLLFNDLKASSELIIQIIILIYRIYKENNIKINNDVFIPVLIFQLNKIKNYYFLDFIIKSNSIYFDESIGFFLIDKSKEIKDNSQSFLFNLGLNILLKNDNKKIFDKLFDLKKYDEILELILQIFYKAKKNKFDKNNLLLKNFIIEQLIKLNKNKFGNEIYV